MYHCAVYYSDNTMHFIDKSKLLGNIFGILYGLLDSNFVHLVVSNFFESKVFLLANCKVSNNCVGLKISMY